MKKLFDEALKITKELGNVIFIGALATHVYTKSGRDSKDLDFVVESPISDEDLIAKGYHKSMTGKQPWFTPRGFKIDIYSGDIPGVSHEALVKYAIQLPVDKKGIIRVMGLEALVVAKHRAARDQDIEDLRNIAQSKFKEIKWDVIDAITNDSFKTANIRKDMEFLLKSQV